MALKYQIDDKHTLNAGFGMHSQMQPMDAYYFQLTNPDGTIDRSNRNLDFTRSRHYVLGYEVLPAAHWRVKTEFYYQYLDNIPVTKTPGSFSMINAGSHGYNEMGNLENAGTGFNYGAELTVERFFNNGYYGLFTGSVYESKYEGSDGIERNTAFNGRFAYNLLGGKEWSVIEHLF